MMDTAETDAAETSEEQVETETETWVFRGKREGRFHKLFLAFSKEMAPNAQGLIPDDEEMLFSTTKWKNMTVGGLYTAKITRLEGDGLRVHAKPVWTGARTAHPDVATWQAQDRAVRQAEAFRRNEKKAVLEDDRILEALEGLRVSYQNGSANQRAALTTWVLRQIMSPSRIWRRG